MCFPIRTDRRNERLPWVNYGLIAANVIVFLLTQRQIHLFSRAIVRGYSVSQIEQVAPVVGYYLWPSHPRLYQFLTYQFLHEGWGHLLGNMIFLWVFGNAVEDRLGKIGYLLFYLAGGVLAGVGFALPGSPTPVLGASGAIAAVTGAFLALFPLTNITLLFFFGWVFEISALVLILFQIGENLVLQWLGVGHVAYLAHLTGYAFGFVVGMGLLLTRVLPRKPYDMLTLIDRRRRQREFEQMIRSGANPWEPATSPPPSAGGEGDDLSPQQHKLMRERARISDALTDNRPQEAALAYQDMLRDHPRQVLSQQQQLDVANQLMGLGRYDTAAAAYELMLSNYPNYPQTHQMHLILGLIYARHLDQPQRARELLQTALPRLDGEDKQLAGQVLTELDSER